MGFWKKFWHFIWDDDSIWSWLANIVLAFVLIKYIVYPGLGLVLYTQYPVVAVVSSSMHHTEYFDEWWENSKNWYVSQGITKENFSEFPMKNGFNKGDIMVLYGKSPEKTDTGEIIVFQSEKPDPIIHRVINKREENGKIYYQTKGDNYVTNPLPIQTNGINELHVPSEEVKGVAVFRIPYLGYVKILALRLVCMFGVLCPQEYSMI